MMIDKKIKLDRYYEETRFGYILIDGKFKYLKLDKEKVFIKLGISGATFRTNKNREKIKSREMLRALLKYVDLEDIKIENKIKYENYIEVLIYNIIYKNEIRIEEELAIIDNYIKESSYIKPIFILLKIFLKITNYRKSKDFINEDVKKDYEYIKYFKDYFIEGFESIYYLIALFLTEKIKPEFKKHIYFQKGQLFHGVYSYMISTIYYMKKEYAKAILYALNANESFINDLNMNRLIVMNINLCGYYNKVKAYEQCVELSNKVFHTLQYKMEYRNILSYIQTHLIIALLHLNMNEEAFNIYKKYIDLNSLQDEYLIILYIWILYLKDENWKTNVIILRNGNNTIVDEFENFLTTNEVSLALDRLFKGAIGQEIVKFLQKNDFFKVKQNK